MSHIAPTAITNTIQIILMSNEILFINHFPFSKIKVCAIEICAPKNADLNDVVYIITPYGAICQHRMAFFIIIISHTKREVIKCLYIQECVI